MEYYNLKYYHNQSVVEDAALLQKDDAITFSVLASIPSVGLVQGRDNCGGCKEHCLLPEGDVSSGGRLYL